MPTDLRAEYDLFLDESGTFKETSTVLAERVEAVQQDRNFPSQLAGLLVPRGVLTEGKAKEVRNQALAAIGRPKQPVHASKLLPEVGRESYNRFVIQLANDLRTRSWQAVRLVNREQVRYGDCIATYTNLVAELVLRVLQQKLREGQPRVTLRLFCARVKLGETPDGTLLFLDREEYLRRVTEYLGFAAVRRGVSQESAEWRVDDLQLRSGKDEPQLQLCDVMSHASHDKFRPCEPPTAEALRAAFGPYDFTLVFRELLDRVDHYLNDSSLALAIMALAERLIQGNLEPDLDKGARERLALIVEQLAGHSAPARDPHLAMLVSWLEQIIEQQRSLELGYRLANCLQAEVDRLLREKLSGDNARSLDWFSYALHTWALTASNHRGALDDARRESEQLERLAPTLAGQWEHATLLMKGMVAESVHLTDCFDHASASSRMKLVVNYYEQLGDLFQAALPSVFPSRVRSDLCGRSLGTWLQSEIFAGLQEPQRLSAARSLSDRAIDEFTAEADNARQYQYRSQLETAAGCFSEARKYLALSLGQDNPSHASIAEGIVRLGDQSSSDQGFPLLHWFRLGTTAALDGADKERDEFLAAIAETGILNSLWCKGDATEEYPTHGILRRAALVRSMLDEPEAALVLLSRLHEVTKGGGAQRVILRALQLAAHAEVGAMIWARGHAKQARLILDGGNPKLPALRALLPDLERKTRESYPHIWRVFAPWSEALSQALSKGPAAEAARVSLQRMARAIGY